MDEAQVKKTVDDSLKQSILWETIGLIVRKNIVNMQQEAVLLLRAEGAVDHERQRKKGGLFIC